MPEILFPNDAPMTTGINTYYLSLKRLVEYYQREAGSGCVHFRRDSVDALLFFDEKSVVDAIFWDENGKSTGAAATEILNAEIKKKNFRVSVYAIRPEAIRYWVSLIHAAPQGASMSVSFESFLALLEKQYEGRPLTGYYRVQGDKRRQLGWVLFQDKRIYGFRLPGERAAWMEPEEMLDFMERFRNASEIHIDVWGLGTSHGTQGGGKPVASEDTVHMLQELIRAAEDLLIQLRLDKKMPFPILFRKTCVAWANIYEFLDPFAADLEYRDGVLIFNGNARDGEVIEGVCRVVTALMEEQGGMDSFSPVLENWKKQYQKRLSELQIRFS